jgi:adenylate cyclase
MTVLIAEGPTPENRWVVELEPHRVYTLGRDAGCDLLVPWDRHVSRRHLELSQDNGSVQVRKLDEATNPLFYAGAAVDSCVIFPGDHFVVGTTSIAFVKKSETSATAPSVKPIEEVTFSREALQQIRYRDADKRIEVLSHLPEVIWGARTDTELYSRLVNLLLAGIHDADAAGIVKVDRDERVEIVQWDRRRETAGAFRPSKRLAVEATLNRRQSVLHVWENVEQQIEFTATHEFDWAFCTPVPGPANEHLALYLGGRFDRMTGQTVRHDGGYLQADVKFAELVAEIFGAVRKLKYLEQEQAGLRQFLPQSILENLGDTFDPHRLAPRELDVTVMFCDLRGFSKQAEIQRDDLKGLLDRVSQALGVMAQHIRVWGGTICDFQGDAAMGFWGFPDGHPDDPIKACRAALAIRADFADAASKKGHPLADFRMGIGLTHGRAVAGRIGTGEHKVITAFGPVVNLASRLEGMTKQLRVPIIIDDALATIVRKKLPPEVGRTRRLAKVQPYGMETPVMVSELLPSAADLPLLTDEHLAAYDAAVEHFTVGEWEEAFAALRTLPSSDRAQDFLSLQIAQHNRVPPPDWSGVVKLPSK